MRKAENKPLHGLKYEESPITPKSKKKPAERKETANKSDFQPMTELEMAKDRYLAKKSELNAEIRKRKAEISKIRLEKRAVKLQFKIEKARLKAI